MKSVIRAENITKKYSKKETILKGISVNVEEGSFTVLLGPSGSGKSTLLNILSGLQKPTSGSVWSGDTEITGMSEKELAEWKRTETGNIFQNYLLLNNLTARENIMIGAPEKGDILPIGQMTQLLNIDGILNQLPSELSGGQQQRVAIARAVIKKPKILFCDEATGALDEANSKTVVELLHHLKQQYGITILFVTHNLQIAETADRIITIKDGIIASDRINTNPITAQQMVWG